MIVPRYLNDVTNDTCRPDSASKLFGGVELEILPAMKREYII